MSDESRIPKTLYDLLGTEPDATRARIKEAYELSVMKVQERVESGEIGALDELRLLRDAFHILHDEDRRRHYDAWIKPKRQDDGTAEKAAESAAKETVTWGIVLLLFALVLAGLWTYLTLLEGAAESPAGFAETVRTERGRRSPAGP